MALGETGEAALFVVSILSATSDEIIRVIVNSQKLPKSISTLLIMQVRDARSAGQSSDGFARLATNNMLVVTVAFGECFLHNGAPN